MRNVHTGQGALFVLRVEPVRPLSFPALQRLFKNFLRHDLNTYLSV